MYGIVLSILLGAAYYTTFTISIAMFDTRKVGRHRTFIIPQLLSQPMLENEIQEVKRIIGHEREKMEMIH